MTEKFKTKYHALAWAAEDENNVFVDGEDFRFRIRNDGTSLIQHKSDGIFYFFNTIEGIKEPCRKLEVEKSNEEVVQEICKASLLKETLNMLLEECDNRYARKK